MRRLPPLHSLRAFEATARLASVSAAAEELSVSHSAVSQQIKVIEDYFGQRLFDRRGRRVEPTPAALSYLEDVRAALDRIALASDRLAHHRSIRAVQINATPSFALRWLIPRTAFFQIDNPDLQLSISTSTSDGIDHLDMPQDFIFRRDAMEREGHVCRRLLDDSSTALVSPEFMARYAPRAPADLVETPLLHARTRPNDWEAWFQSAGVAVPNTVGGAFLDNIFLTVAAAANGVGVAIAPLVLVEDDLESGRLIAPFPDLCFERPGFHLLYRSDWRSERGSRRFLRWLERATGRKLADPADADLL